MGKVTVSAGLQRHRVRMDKNGVTKEVPTLANKLKDSDKLPKFAAKLRTLK
jgi:hypothetical protein